MRVAILLCVALLGACSREPTFDEAFKANEAELASKAAEIDTELDAAASDAGIESEPAATP